MPRALIYIIAIPLVLIIIAAVLVPVLLDKEKVLALASEQVKKQTGAELQVAGETGISVFPTLGITLEQASVVLPDAGSGSVEVDSLEIGVQFMPLLSGEVAIETIALDGVVAKLVTEPSPDPIDTTGMSDEALRAFYDQREAERERAGKKAGSEAALAVPLALEVANLQITNSRIEMTETGGDTSVVQIRELTGKDLNLDGRMMPLDGKIVLVSDTPIEVAFESRLTLSQETQTLSIESLDVQINGALAESIDVSATGDVDISRQIADLALQADIGTTRAEGTLRYASYESPMIDADLRLNQFTPALLALAGPEAAAAEGDNANAETPDGSADDVELPLDALRTTDTRAKLAIEEILWGAHRVTNLKAKLRIVNGAAILPSVTGQVHGGTLDMKANLNAKQSLAKLNTQGSLAGVDIAQVLTAAEVEPVLTGEADLTWKLHGKGNTTNALTRTLRGPIDLEARDAVLQNMGVEKMLCEGVALVNQESLSAAFPENSEFEALAVNIMMGDGKATLQPLKARLPNVRLLGKGAVDISSMNFDTTFTAKLLPGMEQLDPACRINERITNIDWPVTCEGNISGEPGEWCSLETGDILQDIATDELTRKAKKEIERKFGKEAGDTLKKLLGN